MKDAFKTFNVLKASFVAFPAIVGRWA